MKKTVVVVTALFFTLPAFAGSLKGYNDVRTELRAFDGRPETRVAYDKYKESHEHYRKSTDLLGRASYHVNLAEYTGNKEKIRETTAVKKIAYEHYKKAEEDCRAKEAAYIVLHLGHEMPLLNEKLTLNAQEFRNLQK